MRQPAANVGERLAQFRGFGPGFDLLRLVLASGVVLWHCFPLTTGSTQLIEQTPLWFLLSAMVPMFFALSGFLVTASAERTSVWPFLLNRAAPIPALVSVILVAALVVGPIATTLPLGEYFRSPVLYRYLLGVTGLVGFELPGVFGDLPLPYNVNGSLWTVPHELLCYLIVAALMLAGMLRNLRFMLLFFLLLFAGAALAEMPVRPGWAAPLSFLLDSVHFAQGSKIIPYFLFGSILYSGRRHVPDSNLLGWLALAGVLLVGVLVAPETRKGPLLWLVMAAPLTYIVVWLGLKRLPMPALLAGKDLSYGVYLWHFPILQLIVWKAGITHWWLLLPAAIGPVGLVAWVSWMRIEKPALLLRRSIRFSAQGR